MAVVMVMILIAVLFLSGTVMALEISSNFHTVGLLIRDDRIDYAAESAVAREAATAPDCHPLTGRVNSQEFAATCEELVENVKTDPVRVQSVKGGWTTDSNPFPVSVTLPSDWAAFWTVIGWRSSDPAATVTVQGDQAVDCLTQQWSPWSVIYVICRQSDNQQSGNPKNAVTAATLSIAVSGGPVYFGDFVVRAVKHGHSKIVTVIGKSGVEVDEADIAIPSRVVRLWNTVLP
jgi:hypothetical protein